MKFLKFKYNYKTITIWLWCPDVLIGYHKIQYDGITIEAFNFWLFSIEIES